MAELETVEGAQKQVEPIEEAAEGDSIVDPMQEESQAPPAAKTAATKGKPDLPFKGDLLRAFVEEGAEEEVAYEPAVAMDFVAIKGDYRSNTDEKTAATIYGDPALGGTLRERRERRGGLNGYTFDPRWLVPPYRTRYTQAVGALYAKATLQLGGLDAVGGEGQEAPDNADPLKGAPILILRRPAEDGSGWGQDALSSLAAPTAANPYDPTLLFGPVVGRLQEIVADPGSWEELLSRPPGLQVVVEIDPRGPDARLLDPAMLHQEFASNEPSFAYPPGQQEEIAPGVTMGALVPQDLAALQRLTTPAFPGQEILLLDPAGEGGKKIRDNITLLPGKLSRKFPPDAPAYVWDGTRKLKKNHNIKPLIGQLLRVDGGAPRWVDGQTPSRVQPCAVLTVGEILARARRRQAQRLLSRRDTAGKDVLDDKAKARLLSMASAERFAPGTERDGGKALVDTGEDKEDPPIQGEPRGGATALQAAEMMDAALAQVRAIQSQHPRTRPLLGLLEDRLARYRLQQETGALEPGALAGMLVKQIELAGVCGRALTALAALQKKQAGNHACAQELAAIADLYAGALAWSDQLDLAGRLSAEANRRMALYPLFEMKTLNAEYQRGYDAMFAEGEAFAKDDSASFTASAAATAAADHGRDAQLLESALEKAHQAARGDDAEATQRSSQAALGAARRIQNRFTLVHKLYEALTALQSGGFLAKAADTTLDAVGLGSGDAPLFSKVDRLAGELKLLIYRFNLNPDPKAQAQVMADLDALWASDPAYKELYKDIQSFVGTTDFCLQLAILVAAGLVSMGAGALAGGAGVGTMGVFTAETLAFSGASVALEEALLSQDPAAQDPGGEPSLAERFAHDAAMLGVFKGVGRVWGRMGKDMNAMVRGGAQMASTVALMHGLGVAQHAAGKGEMPDLEAQKGMLLSNALGVGLMHISSSLAHPMFERLKGWTGKALGNYKPAAEGLAKRRQDLLDRLKALGKEHARIKKKQGSEEAAETTEAELGKLSEETRLLQEEAAKLTQKILENPRLKEKERAELAEFQSSLSEGTANLADIVATERLGIRGSEGGNSDVMLFNPGKAQAVAKYYREKGGAVQEKVSPEGRVELEVSLREVGTVTLLEARAQSRSAFLQGMSGKGAQKTAKEAMGGDLPPGLDPKTRVVLEGETPPEAGPWVSEVQLESLSGAIKLITASRTAGAALARENLGKVKIELQEGAEVSVAGGPEKGWTIKLGREARELNNPRMMGERLIHEFTHVGAGGKGQGDKGLIAREKEAYENGYAFLREATGGDLIAFADLVQARYGRESYKQLMNIYGKKLTELVRGGPNKGSEEIEAARKEALAYAQKEFGRIIPKLETGQGKYEDLGVRDRQFSEQGKTGGKGKDKAKTGLEALDEALSGEGGLQVSTAVSADHQKQLTGKAAALERLPPKVKPEALDPKDPALDVALYRGIKSADPTASVGMEQTGHLIPRGKGTDHVGHMQSKPTGELGSHEWTINPQVALKYAGEDGILIQTTLRHLQSQGVEVAIYKGSVAAEGGIFIEGLVRPQKYRAVKSGKDRYEVGKAQEPKNDREAAQGIQKEWNEKGYLSWLTEREAAQIAGLKSQVDAALEGLRGAPSGKSKEIQDFCKGVEENLELCSINARNYIEQANKSLKAIERERLLTKKIEDSKQEIRLALLDLKKIGLDMGELTKLNARIVEKLAAGEVPRAAQLEQAAQAVRWLKQAAASKDAALPHLREWLGEATKR